MSQENVQLIRGVYEAFGRGDIPAVLAQMDQSIEWNEAENFIYADRNPYVGPQAVLEGVFTRLGAEWEGFTVTPEELLDAGDRVVALGTYKRDQQGDGKPGTGTIRSRVGRERRKGDELPAVYRHKTVRRCSGMMDVCVEPCLTGY